jgi:type II secretion system protein G
MRRRAFTLVEILVVIAIIGLLSVFLVPKLLGVQDRGKDTAVKSVMHSVQLAIEAYHMENEVYPMGKDINVKSLCENYLMPGNYISAVPKNPFTGKPYAENDTAGKILYQYNDNTGNYTLTGYNRSGRGKVLELNNI